MSITIAEVKQRIASKIHGTSVSKIQDFYGLAFEAAGNLIGKIDIKETVRIEPITNAIYDRVYDYVAPVDLKEDAILSIKPQGYNRKIADNFYNRTEEDFDRFKTSGDFTIQNNSGIKTVRISKSLTANILLSECDEISNGSLGTWAVSSGASNLSVDSLNKVSGNASLKFDLDALGSTGILENSTFDAVDLSTIENTGALFAWVYIPSTTAITSINLRWGSSVTQYWDRTVTTTQNNTAFITGWNLLRFDWSGSTQTLTPDASAINYLRVTLNYTGTAVPSCRVDGIIAGIGAIYEMEYFSKYLFKTTSGVWIEKPTVDTDILNLDVTSINLYLYELAELCGQELAGADSNFDISFISAKKKEVWDAYGQANKSERKKKQTSYYPMIQRRRR